MENSGDQGWFMDWKTGGVDGGICRRQGEVAYGGCGIQVIMGYLGAGR